jgi:hypothetical protein
MLPYYTVSHNAGSKVISLTFWIGRTSGTTDVVKDAIFQTWLELDSTPRSQWRVSVYDQNNTSYSVDFNYYYNDPSNSNNALFNSKLTELFDFINRNPSNTIYCVQTSGFLTGLEVRSGATVTDSWYST